MKDFLYNIIGVIIFFALIVLVLGWAGGSTTNQCGENYHWEEDYRGTVGGCIHN